MFDGEDSDLSFEVEEEEGSEEDFYPAESPFPLNDPRDNQMEIVEPQDQPPPRFNPRSRSRLNPPAQFGRGTGGGAVSRPPTPPQATGSSSFGRTTGQVQFQKTGQSQVASESELSQKKQELENLKREFKSTFGN